MAIESIVYDISGVWYNKDKKNSSHGASLYDAHLFIFYSAWKCMKFQSMSAKEMKGAVLGKYKSHEINGTITKALSEIPDRTKIDFEQTRDEKFQGSNTKTFYSTFDDINPHFFHVHLINQVDLTKFIEPNSELFEMIGRLSETYRQGILTTEAYSTIEIAANILGIDLSLFDMQTGDSCSVLCNDNLKFKKPDVRAFNRVLSCYPDLHPSSIAYVGDHLKIDIIPALEAGITPIHVLNDKSGIKEETALVGSKCKYISIGNTLLLEDVLSR